MTPWASPSTDEMGEIWPLIPPGILARWAAYTGWIAVLGSVAGVFFLPFVLPLLWYLAVSIVGLTRASPAPVAVTAPTS
jgi:hypothetical protein